MHIKKLIIASYSLLIVIMLITFGCGQKKAIDVTQSVVSVQSSTIEILKLKLGPISTFERTCARCHGPQGAFYGDEFAQLNDQELHKIIRQMMVGPAFLKPKSHEVNAMAAYHRALSAKEPFLCVTSYTPNEQTKTASLAGEATSGSKIEFSTKNKDMSISPNEQGIWSLAEMPPPPFKLIVILDEKSKEITIPKSQWTHSTNK
ncbi:MAG: c-type cytochrome [Planctomycetota bacterium]|jgi:cytochrome c553